MMISSTINKESASLSQNSTVVHGALLKNDNHNSDDKQKDLSLALQELTIKDKKKYKTIQDINPNPNLLSKKAIKTRKMKMEAKMKNEIINKQNSAIQKITTPDPTENIALGDRQLEIIKSSTLLSKFDTRSTLNAIKLPPRKISQDPQPIRILGSRQKKVTNKIKSTKQSKENKANLYSKDSLKLADYIASRYQLKNIEQKDKKVSNLSKTTSRHNSQKSFNNNVSNVERSLGSRQVGLLNINTLPVQKSSPKHKKRIRGRKGRKGKVRKVLKGRRKITSGELRRKASSFFI